MHTYTRQQLSGGPKYSGKVKIGNWSEDRSRVETESKDYELRKSRGQLASTHKATARLVSLQSVPHSYSADGVLRYGQTVQLSMTTTQEDDSKKDYYLANNVFDRVDFVKNTISVTATEHAPPVARNTFVLVRPFRKTGRATGALFGFSDESKSDGAGAGSGSGSEDVVCYGDRVFLATNPSLRVDDRTGMVAAPYLLSSEVSSALTGSGKGKQKQEVMMSLKPSPQCEWKIIAASGDDLATDGLPVKAGDAVSLVHASTNQALGGLGSMMQSTDFGTELDLHAFTYKKPGLVSEGRIRPMLPANAWSFVLADDPEAAVDTRGFKPLTPEALIAKVRGIINTRGQYAIRGLGRSFRIMDDRRDGKLDREDFKWGLYDYGVKLTDEEFDMVLDAFDRNDDGKIDFTEFLVTLRGELNARRLTFIHEAFRRLDKDGSGIVTLSDLVTVYDTSFHPEVQAGRATHEEVVAEFMSQWEKDDDGEVTKEDFEEYYKDVSASIDSDDYFELMMRNAWHISGGEGQMENTSNRRVLVIHTDGSQEVVEIKDDLGFDATADIAATIARLESQGVKDIGSISFAN